MHFIFIHKTILALLPLNFSSIHQISDISNPSTWVEIEKTYNNDVISSGKCILGSDRHLSNY